MTDGLPDGYLLLTDWTQHTDPEAQPEPAHIVGAWSVWPDGSRGRFEPNPGFRPNSPQTPSDPFDAASKFWARNEVTTEDLVNLLNDMFIGVAVDEAGTLLVRTLPDGLRVITVTTAPIQAGEHPHWETTTLDDLGPVLPEGVGMVVNPDSATPVVLRTPPRNPASAGPGRSGA